MRQVWALHCFSCASVQPVCALYAVQMTAHRAFAFCLQHKRTNEFRRLCEILRNHLANLNKYRDQRDRPDLSQPESLQLYLDTRFEQLKVATELELWQVRGSFGFNLAFSVAHIMWHFGAAFRTAFSL